MTLPERARSVRTRSDLVDFLRALEADFADNPEEWDNGDLASFLEAMAAWSADMEGFYLNSGEDLDALPPWRVLADILMAARAYE
jgi:hypothetical protein